MSIGILQHGNGTSFNLIQILLLALTAGYMAAAIRSGSRYKPWPLPRYFYWISGVLCAAAAVTGPLAIRAHSELTAHMAAHLLLGMLSPLFLTLAAPVTLLFKALNVRSARRLARFLKSRPLRFISHPITASALNVGGLWLLYTTDLFMAMQHNPILNLFVHLHIWIAGWVFTASIIYIDPTPHRFGFLYRAGVFVPTFAAHAILAKYIYAHPPAGVPYKQAEMGGMIMYYGGDIIEIALVCIFWHQWSRRLKPSENRMQTRITT